MAWRGEAWTTGIGRRSDVPVKESGRPEAWRSSLERGLGGQKMTGVHRQRRAALGRPRELSETAQLTAQLAMWRGCRRGVGVAEGEGEGEGEGVLGPWVVQARVDCTVAVCGESGPWRCGGGRPDAAHDAPIGPVAWTDEDDGGRGGVPAAR